jgi:hypothetical protein
MNYRTPGGPSAAELRPLFRSLAQTKQIIAVSMSSRTPNSRLRSLAKLRPSQQKRRSGDGLIMPP